MSRAEIAGRSVHAHNGAAIRDGDGRKVRDLDLGIRQAGRRGKAGSNGAAAEQPQ